MAVLRDRVRSAARVGRSRRAEGRFLEDTAVPWGLHVAVMFQIVSALAMEVQDIGTLRGVSPDLQLSCEPWGHANHSGGGCDCLSSDRTGAYMGWATLPGNVRTGEAIYRVSLRGGRDRCHSCLIDQALMVASSCLCTCGGRRARDVGRLEGRPSTHSVWWG